MAQHLLRKYSGNVPRYTSYPTAPHFHEEVGPSTYATWLGALGARDTVSLYIHIPYCDRLCWFCACHTKQTHKYEPVRAYLDALYREIETVGALVSDKARVTALHLGGGSPTMLEPEDLIELKARLSSAFSFAEDAEISVEMDPNDLDGPRYDALAAIGMNRASLGVQDFTDKVQQAINRIQTFAQTRSVVEEVRKRGVRSLNCDIVYGLPHQTMETLAETIDDIIHLNPDRVALFGYAHVPWMKKHQTMIDEASLPGPDMRYRLMNRAGSMLRDAGYVAIGIDHFARPEDRLAIAAREGRLTRNFQGYTDENATALIGLGASSIGKLPQGYVQNNPATGVYQKQALAGGLTTLRGVAFTEDDLLRAHVIERLMCDYQLSFADLSQRFGAAAGTILAEAQSLVAGDDEGHVALVGDRLIVADEAKPFVRSIAACFDAYLAQGRGRHSAAV
ncbi:oxygen-independent coproporphyrinogen-3 oxidase [Rhizobium sp. SG_E_25_P2]|uniref:oxygen-independent coproporphyrinogen III oxidase n=1 Tax=Rhizobium sp. SG_E_25_P2 TaxID=2879942 RepID=UPI0024771BF9|nr:oxygen-independent coproporphyrinogen III oxidase [Rhizobium sp. SG_E_25_P2]MDH6267273.1 oxygen-independent coproporphyrinogen-3 oxidase [Rhizobium sp. SG_E_25_P2]